MSQNLVSEKNLPIAKVLGSNGITKTDAGDEKRISINDVTRGGYAAVKTDDDDRGNILRVALSQPILVTKGLGHQTEAMSRSFGSGIMNRRDILYQGSLENVRAKSCV